MNDAEFRRAVAIDRMDPNRKSIMLPLSFHHHDLPYGIVRCGVCGNPVGIWEIERFGGNIEKGEFEPWFKCSKCYAEDVAEEKAEAEARPDYELGFGMKIVVGISLVFVLLLLLLL